MMVNWDFKRAWTISDSCLATGKFLRLVWICFSFWKACFWRKHYEGKGNREVRCLGGILVGSHSDKNLREEPTPPLKNQPKP